MSATSLPAPLDSPDTHHPSALLFSKLKWLMFIRLLLATSLFGSTLFLQLRNGSNDTQISLLYGLSAALYLASGVFAAVVKRARNLERFAYLQFTFDVLFITPVIYLTGGIESIFSFLYFWVIISASYLLYTPGGFYAAAISGIAYAALVTVQVRRIFPSFADNPGAGSDLSYVLYNVSINVFAFLLVAFLSSYLAEQLKRTKEALLEEQSNLRELEELNRKIVENISSGMITIDSTGNISYLNRAAEVILGRDRAGLLKTPIDQLFPGTLNSLQDIDLGEGSILRPTRWERHITRRDRQRLYLGFSSSPLRNLDGQAIGNILIFEDLTRIKYLEEKARRDDRLKAIGRLAAGLAHEIRNPLASISGSIQVLRDELDVRDENRALMDIAVRETDRLNVLLTDFLQYVKPGNQERTEVALGTLLREVIEALKQSPKCHAAIQVVLRTEHSYALIADAGQLRQVVWNLVLNAVEVMPDGGLLEVTTRDVPPNPGDVPRVELRVKDTGPGVDPAHLERLFDPFFSTKTGGTGLGLALVEKIVQAHDGAIKVRPNPEGGTVFEVLLPALDMTAGLVTADVELPESSPSPLGDPLALETSLETSHILPDPPLRSDALTSEEREGGLLRGTEHTA